MTKNMTLSLVLLIPLAGIGGIVGSSLGSRPLPPEPNTAVTIKPLEIHQATNVSKVLSEGVSDLF